MRRVVVAAAFLLAWVGSSTAADAKGPHGAYHGRGTANVFWFLHISDLHIGSSTFEDPQQVATPHLEFALNLAVPVISPSFVLATGDLCDGSQGVLPTVGQQQDEWDAYKSIYTAALMKPNFYFDLPGNHDAYGETNGLASFLKNSLQGKNNGVPYVSWTVKVPDGEMLFFGLNSAGKGIAPVTNPQGNFTDDELDFVDGAMTAHPNAQLVLMAGHHPLSGATNAARLEAAYKQAAGGYYLHGHRHAYTEYLGVNDTVVVNEIGSLGKATTDNLGVVAIDHKGLVYRATGTAKPWPFVVITAPMASDLRDGTENPYAYRVCKDRKDNAVRALVFSDKNVNSVIAQIGTMPSVVMRAADTASPLWEGEIDTTELTVGKHEVTVTAKVGSEVAAHTLNAEFISGPCKALPIDPVETGGAAGSAGAAGGAGSAGAAGSAAGSPGKGGAGQSTGGTAGAWDAGSDAGSGGSKPNSGSAEQVPEEGGCTCAAVGTSNRHQPAWTLMIAAAATALLRRARRSHAV
jgi:hypothetical protein